MKSIDLDRSIKKAVECILKMREFDNALGKSPIVYPIIKGKLDRAERHLSLMFDELESIDKQLETNRRWFGYFDVRLFIKPAMIAAGPALDLLADAKAAIRRNPATRAKPEQWTAVFLAHIYLERPGEPNRGTRELARRIMLAAGIEEPTEEAMTKWLREIRKDAVARDSRANISFPAK